MTPEVSYIIPVSNNGKPDFSHRCKNLQFIVENFLMKQKDVEFEVIFVEQIVHKGLKQYRDVLGTPCGYRFITVEYPQYNKCWCLNVAVKLAKAPIVMMAEADMFSSDFMYVQRAAAGFRAVSNGKWCFGWDRLKYLSEAETNDIRRSGAMTLGTVGSIQMPRPSGPEGGILIYDRDWYLKIGGHNEWIQGLGGPDNEMADRAKWWSNSYPKLPHFTYHLWHPIIKPSMKGMSSGHRQYNRSIVRLQRSMMPTIAPLLARQDIGNLHSPLCANKTYVEMRTK